MTPRVLSPFDIGNITSAFSARYDRDASLRWRQQLAAEKLARPSCTLCRGSGWYYIKPCECTKEKP